MKCLFVYNPNSGRGKILRKCKLIEKTLSKRYDSVTIYPTKSVEDLENTVRNSVGVYDTLVFSGGDGTFNHILKGLDGKEMQLGYLPSGTTNDVAHSLRIPRTLKGALNVIVKGETRAVDCMRVNGEYVMYVSAAGLFTRATYATPQAEKRAFGMLAYLAEVLRHELAFDNFKLKITNGEETKELSAVLVLVMNGISVAGFPVNKRGDMQDGEMEVAIIRQLGKPNFFKRLGSLFSLARLMLFGYGIREKNVEYMKGKRFSIETEEGVVWDFDGEEGVKGSVTVESVPSGVKIFAPKQKNKKS